MGDGTRVMFLYIYNIQPSKTPTIKLHNVIPSAPIVVSIIREISSEFISFIYKQKSTICLDKLEKEELKKKKKKNWRLVKK